MRKPIRIPIALGIVAGGVWALGFLSRGQMKTLWIVLAGLSLLVAVFRGQPTPLPSVTLRDIARVLATLSATCKDGNFAVFLFAEADQAPAADGALNVQLSLEGGRLGIDWVLLAPVNLESQSRFVAFFERMGHTIDRREMRRVKYLRVEDGHLAELLRDFLTTEFKVTPEQKMGLITEGFVLAG
jgi:hypothetical protein